MILIDFSSLFPPTTLCEPGDPHLRTHLRATNRGAFKFGQPLVHCCVVINFQFWYLKGAASEFGQTGHG